MSEIDPWALPQGGANTAVAGIPTTAPWPTAQAVRPLPKVLPIIMIALSAVYVVVMLVQLFAFNNEISLVNQFTDAIDNGSLTDDQVNRLNNADSLINHLGLASGLIYLVIIGLIIAWQIRLNKSLGSVGARRAVFRRAGYQYFRLTWLASFIIGIVVTGSTNNQTVNSVQDVLNHDHLGMVYCGVRAVLGAVLIFFAFRLKKISEEGLGLLDGANFGGKHL